MEKVIATGIAAFLLLVPICIAGLLIYFLGPLHCQHCGGEIPQPMTGRRIKCPHCGQFTKTKS